MLSRLLRFLSDKAGPLSPRTPGASRHPAGLGLNPSDRVPFPLSHLRSVVQEGDESRRAEPTDSYRGSSDPGTPRDKSTQEVHLPLLPWCLAQCI